MGSHLDINRVTIAPFFFHGGLFQIEDCRPGVERCELVLGVPSSQAVLMLPLAVRSPPELRGRMCLSSAVDHHGRL